ncbi:MAG: TauD/TfdA family dioxygenase, partial [Gammaproteobacteria bacterium]
MQSLTNGATCGYSNGSGLKSFRDCDNSVAGSLVHRGRDKEKNETAADLVTSTVQSGTKAGRVIMSLEGSTDTTTQQIPDNSPDNGQPKHPVHCPGLWTAPVVGKKWVYRLDEAAIGDIDIALKHVERRHLRAPDFGAADFPLEGFGDQIRHIMDELEFGRGFVLIRGFPFARYSQEQAATVFWGLSSHMGTHVAINANGDKLGHVKDLGLSANDVKVRNYQTREALNYHNDKSDVIGLMCIHAAKQGGASSVASAPAIHNAILERHPELLEHLYRPMAIDRRGEPGGQDLHDKLDYYALPVFSWHQSNLTTRYSVRSYYDTAQRFEGAPPLGPEAARALDKVLAIANEPNYHVNFMLEPGDMQFMNNYAVLHSRSAFVDHDDIERRRHLLRVWLAVPNSRELP